MKHLDRHVSKPLHDIVLGPLDYVLVVPGMLFGSYGMPFTLLLVGLWLGWKVAVVAIVASIITVALTDPMKHYFQRQRPAALSAARKIQISGLVSNPSFPSGDSAQAGMVTALLFFNSPYMLEDWRRYLCLIVAPACMFARVYFGAHWIGDTIAGAAIGAGVAIALQGLFGDFLAAV